MLLTDGPRFYLEFTDIRQLVWRMPKERLDDLNVTEHGRYGKSSVMIGTGIGINGKADLNIIEKGTLVTLRD